MVEMQKSQMRHNSFFFNDCNSKILFDQYLNKLIYLLHENLLMKEGLHEHG